MALDHRNLSLFGLDLRVLCEHWRQGLAEAAQRPPLSWLLPVSPLLVHRPDGSAQTLYPNGQAAPAETGARKDSAVAALLPADLFLAGTLELPAAATRAERERAVQLAVFAASPFPEEETVWGYQEESAGGAVRLHYALASRPQILHDLEGRKMPDPATRTGMEIWAWHGGRPVVMRGFGEAHRYRRERQTLARTLLLIASLSVLLLILAAVPVLHLRQQAFEAQERFHALSRQTAPITAERETLASANVSLQAIQRYADARPAPDQLLARLTGLLPDSVYLQRLDMQGTQVSVGGQADNAGALIELLGAQSDFHEVRASSAIVRNQVTGRETFAIQFSFDEADSPR